MSKLSHSEIRLTETVKKGGCAAKLPAGELRQVLGNLKLPKPPELLVGTEWLDDAALWDLGDGRCLVQTLDFFTPIVDDAYQFGAIAAANAISDVYAMGGVPKTVMSILAFPSATLPLTLLEPLLRGALDVIIESGSALVGGHTIDDETLKLGFSVTGFVERGRAWTNAGALPGDALLLTKGLGTGTITSAIKAQKAEAAWIESAIASMTLLNRAPEILGEIPVHAATDITGFGFLGHALQMAKASGVAIELQTARLPLLTGAQICLEQLQILNRAHRTNWDYVKNEVIGLPDSGDWRQHLLTDAQTSGGLLLAIPEAHAERAKTLLLPKFPSTEIVGTLRKYQSGPRITVQI